MLKTVVLVMVIAGVAGAFGLDPSDFSLTPSSGYGHGLHFSNSMSFSWNTAGGHSWGTGLYTGRTSLLLRPGLTANLDVGYCRLIRVGADDSGLYLGGVGLDWKPSDNLLLQFHVGGAFSGETFGGY